MSGFCLLLLVHMFAIRKYYTNESADICSALFETALNISFGFIASSLLLLFASNSVFLKWF